jgi:hypothetical protein
MKTIEERMKTLSLEQAEFWFRNGLCTQTEFETYCHAWQTGAPRFSVQACWCAQCVKTGPFADACTCFGLGKCESCCPSHEQDP